MDCSDKNSEIPEASFSAGMGRSEDSCGTEISDMPHTVLHHIFGMLGPRELCLASAVCKDWRELNCDSTSNRTWRDYYSKMWRAPQGIHESQWQIQYGQKMKSARAFSNKGMMDILYGHTGAVTGCALLPSHNLLASGSVDNTVRLWDLQAGLPIASSRQLKGPIRAVAMDESMLVCGGGPDGMVRLWRSGSPHATKLFDLSVPTRLVGHTGPVSSVTLDQRHIISASWDCTVRIWDKQSLTRESLLAFPDWIHSVKSRAGNLLVTAGNVLHGHSMETGQALFKFGHSALKGSSHWDEARSTAPLQVEGSQDGKNVFLAGADGAIVSVDLRAPRAGSVVLWNQKAAVKSLKYEHPWLACATSDGSILLLDVEASAHQVPVSSSRMRSASKSSSPGLDFAKRNRASRQRLNGSHQAALCVDIQDNYVVCGSCDPVVRTWHFEHTEKREKRAVTAPRRIRQSKLRVPRQSQREAIELDSDEDSDGDESDHRERGKALTPTKIPLSNSLPSQLGGVSKFMLDKEENPPRKQSLSTEDNAPERRPNKVPRDDSSSDDAEERASSPSPRRNQNQDRWDMRTVDDVPSDSSEFSDEAMILARQRHSRENEYKVNESPPRGLRTARSRPKMPVLCPESCRSESRRTASEHMENWSLYNSRMHRPL